eukprot:9540363-Heterocapsa_arctica.AAC.1
MRNPFAPSKGKARDKWVQGTFILGITATLGAAPAYSPNCRRHTDVRAQGTMMLETAAQPAAPGAGPVLAYSRRQYRD